MGLCMSDKTFVDTNIFVYSRDSSEPEKQEKAVDLLARLWKERTGRVSVQVCNEYFVTVTQKLKPGLEPEEAWEDIVSLAAWEPTSIDMKSLHKAREIQRKYQLSWWDSLIVASAFLSGCTTIVSEDLNPGQIYFGIEAFNPFG